MSGIKYTILFFLILSLVSCQQEVSPEQAEKFIKFYGGSMMDEAKDIEVLDDGTYAICGIDSTSGEGKRAVLIVTDTYGNMLSGFPKYYSADGGHNSGANTLVVKNGGTGGFLLAGYVDIPVGDSTQRDLFLVRTSSSGRELWKRNFGTEEDESVLHATEMISTNGFILAGYAVKNGKQDIMIKGVDDQGEEIDLGLNYPNPLADDGAANYIYNTGENYLTVCTYDKVGSAGTDIVVLAINTELSFTVINLGGDFDEVGQSLTEVGENNYLVLGNRVDVRGTVEVVVHQVEVDGILPIDSKLVATISEPNADLIAKRLIRTEDGRVAIVGTRRSEGNSDIFLQFLESNFSQAERVLFGEAGDQRGADIALPLDEGLILLGTNDYGSTSLISLIRTDGAGNL